MLFQGTLIKGNPKTVSKTRIPRPIPLGVQTYRFDRRARCLGRCKKATGACPGSIAGGGPPIWRAPSTEPENRGSR